MPTAHAAPTADPAITAARRQLEAEALATWRGWIDDVVAGGDMPDLRAVFEVGAILGVTQPLDTLEADIAARREVEGLELQAEKERHYADEQLRPYGGPAGVQAALVEAEGKVQELKRLASGYLHWGASHAAGAARRLRLSNPRAFPPAAPKAAEKSSKPKPRPKS